MLAIYLLSFHPFAKEAITYTLDRDFQLNEVLIYYGYSFHSVSNVYPYLQTYEHTHLKPWGGGKKGKDGCM